MNITITGDAIAWWGAILSTVAIIILILNYLGQRVRIKVSARQTNLLGVPGEPREVVVLSAVNIGTRPVKLVAAELILERGLRFVPSPLSYFGKPLPGRLEEGEGAELWAEADEVREQEREHSAKVIGVCFRDAAGRTFRSKFQTQETRKERKQHRTGGP